MGYVTRDDMKAYLRINADDSDHDDQVDAWIAEATAWIDMHTSRVFVSDTIESREFHISEVLAGVLWLGEELCDVDNVTVTTSEGVLLSNEYTLLPRRSTAFDRVQINVGSSWGTGDITIQGYHAYSKVPPELVTSACKRLVKHYSYLKEQGGQVEREIVSEDGTVTRPSQIPLIVFENLRGFVREVPHGIG